MHPVRLLILVFTFGLSFSQYSQAQSKTIDTLLINEFAQPNFARRGLEYREVYQEAEKIFKKGKRVNRAHLERTFPVRDIFAPLEKNLTRIVLFQGSNGIIGKNIVLTIDENDRVRSLEIMGFGM